MKMILAINAGSSSLKYKIFSVPDEKVIASGMAERIGLKMSDFELKYQGEKYTEKLPIESIDQAVKILLEALKKYQVVTDLHEIDGVGHRVVAGGEVFQESTIIDQAALEKIKELADYAPLHNPGEARAIEAFMNLLPGVPQVGVFDTSFHHTMDPVHYLYSLPYEYYEKYGIRRYGAHGTSVRYVSKRACEMVNHNFDKMIICHLGSGASVTALEDGKSFDTSMGFSPLAGVTMGTRSGDIDPAAIQLLMKKEKISFDEAIDILNHKSGLLGISGMSSDMRDLEKSDEPRAILARKIFVNRIIRYVGSYAVEMGGLDALIFTAGIGEHDKHIVNEICKRLTLLGVKIDPDKMKYGEESIIDTADSKVKVLIVPTDEELMICRDVSRLAKI
ncbi:MAG: acetate kinase [Lactobacillus sp.]|nr:acetate kinase [Lactobacillus sp.]